MHHYHPQNPHMPYHHENMQMPYHHENMHMQPQQVSPEAHKQQMHQMCNNYKLYFVQIQTTDGQMYDGIIEDSDDDGMTLLSPYGDMDREDERQFFGPYGFGHHGFGFPRRFRRFRRRRFPFFGIHRLFFPFFY